MKKEQLKKNEKKLNKNKNEKWKKWKREVGKNEKEKWEKMKKKWKVKNLKRKVGKKWKRKVNKKMKNKSAKNIKLFPFLIFYYFFWSALRPGRMSHTVWPFLRIRNFISFTLLSRQVPGILIFTILSSIGNIVFTSPSVKWSPRNFRSARNVPEFNSATSHPEIAFITSAVNDPILVSCVRMRAKRVSMGCSNRTTCLPRSFRVSPV